MYVCRRMWLCGGYDIAIWCIHTLHCSTHLFCGASHDSHVHTTMRLVAIFIFIVIFIEYTAALWAIRVNVFPIADGGCELLPVMYVVATVGVLFHLLVLVVAAAEVQRIIYRKPEHSRTRRKENPCYIALQVDLIHTKQVGKY